MNRGLADRRARIALVLYVPMHIGLLQLNPVVGDIRGNTKGIIEAVQGLDADVLVTGSGAAKETALQLASEIKGARAVDSGPLRYSRFVEGITILLIGINSRYKTHTGVTIRGLE